MIRISKMTDYATVLLAALAHAGGERLSTAALAERTHIAATTVAKVLKLLHRGGLVHSTRGLHGGYALAKPAAAISAAAIADASHGSSPMYSKLRPLRGTRAKQTPGPSCTFAPFL
jgi:Rrf2 family protein